MIFVLKNTVSGKTISLSIQKDYIVGRKNCDILLENDQSISREHAIIRVKNDHVTLEDCKSKYHTLRNGAQVSPQVEIRLEHMDSIQFGVFNSKFSFEAYRFITAASALSGDKKTTLKENIAKCNGKYVEKWSSSCTHLTIEKISLTIKVLQALIDEKPIVTPEYWSKYAESIEKNKPPPDINKYNKPPIAEQLLSSDFQHKFDSRRRTLFSDKMFVFLKSNTKEQMEEIIKACGGDCMSWEEEGPKTVYEISISPKQHLIIKTDNDEENVSFNAIVTDLIKNKKRAIPLNEIALAIVHCSCEINCNPDFNKVTEVFGARTQKQQTMRVLAAETQSEMVTSSDIKTEKVIPASVEDDWTSHVPVVTVETARPGAVKRPIGDQGKDGVLKKLKTVEKEEENNKEKEKEKVTRIGNKNAVSPINTTNNRAEDGFQIRPQPPQKRKAEEDLQALNPKKSNPFSSLRVTKIKRNTSIDDDDNPFELTRASSNRPSRLKSPPAKNNNPFAQLRTISKSSHTLTIEAEEMLEPKKESRMEIELIPKKKDTLVITPVKRSLSNTIWLDKNVTPEKKIVQEQDSELLHVLEAFKNCVKVQTLHLFNKKEKSKENLDDHSFHSVDGKKNFKNFKKVQPIKPQVTIIPRTRLTKIGPGNLTGLPVSSLEDSDDEAGSSKSKKKPKLKKFVF